MASVSLVCWLGASGFSRERLAVLRDEEAARLVDFLPEASQPIDWNSDSSTLAHATVNMVTNERIATLRFQKDLAQRSRVRRRSWHAWLAWRPRRGARRPLRRRWAEEDCTSTLFSVRCPRRPLGRTTTDTR